MISRAHVTVVVVDDEAPVLKALARLLRASGYAVKTFTSGHEFLDALGAKQSDCVIMDLHLPGLSGLEVQRRLVQERVHLPCIIITGKDEPGGRERALACGVVAYLMKPFDEQSLLAAVESALPGGTPTNTEPC